MGKNTLMKRCIRLYADRTKEEKWNVLLDYLVGNVGIIFTNVSLCCLHCLYTRSSTPDMASY